MNLRLPRIVFTAESIGLILVFVALATMTYGISSSLRGVDPGSLLRVCIIAALLSLGLAKTKLSGIPASVVMIVLGLAGIWVLGAGITRPLIDLLRSLIAVGPQIFPNINYRFDIDTSQLVINWQTILSASTALGIRLKTWFTSIGTEHVLSDPLIRNLIWVLAFWFLAAWMGWFTGKRSAITALLPAIMVMAEVTSYSGYRIESMWLMVFVMLLLMGVWNYRNSTAQWERHKVDYSDSILYDNTQAVLFLSLAISSIALITPSISWRDVRDYLREHERKQQGETPAQLLGIKEQPSQPKTYVQTPSLPREHLLTGGFAQSEKIVMTIRTGELPPIDIPSATTNAPQYYWRSTIYDEYMGAGWVTSPAPPQNYKANTPLISGVLDGYRPLHLDVQIQEPEGKLFWSGILYSADIPFRGDWRVRPGSDLFADQTALVQADIFIAAISATSYTAQTYIPDITIQDLRTAPTEYPEDVQKRYLQLPPELPDRIQQLAMQVVQGKTNPYEKAKAIEGYLRMNYPYDLNVPVPPNDKDVADYFLFELKRGYCDYYATAFVVLARSVGVPARFVSGYASGDYDAANARYIVRELHAHSWPEVYFPNIGWIEFEPTAAQPEISRPEKASDLPPQAKHEDTTSRFLFELSNTKLIYWSSPLILGSMLLLFYYAIFESIIYRTFDPNRAIEKLYQKYYRLGRPLAGKHSRAETAHEFTANLIHEIENIYVDSNHRDFPKYVQASADQLTSIYQQSLFSNRAVDKHDARTTYNLWKQLRRDLIVSRIMNFVQTVNNWVKNKVTRLSFKPT